MRKESTIQNQRFMYHAISAMYGNGKESIFRTRDSEVIVHGSLPHFHAIHL